MNTSERVARDLLRVQRASIEEVEAVERLRQAVSGAIRAGASWAQVATHLGVTERAARRRFGSPPAPEDQTALF
ncbi:hypothetical protein [Corynebacterium pygosceleis]|uniref:Uncharacterized protein n=1 Tax=Corynebacterium pygosceleis TaxID=2800406 RepID=A0A9Q4GKK0_9CORY|nr:hypothetical protein [Corynebacterium pygosceleis]MCK7636727.1 hypothetical protein [Corynebacterium pygosceleis]MCL0120485.1 hypothetical protein [Corynebacterium pygosceleis]MCX7467480.1 hypothetical protein [Corynebacterium pygosceleis]